MPPTNPPEFMGAADEMLAQMEASRLVSREELEAVRQDLVKQIREEAVAGTKKLGTAKVGGARIIIPNSKNLRDIKLISERTRKRMSNFRLHYLAPEQLEGLQDLNRTPKDTKQFIRHSRRMARHARHFLGRIKELEPDLEEEVDQALMQLEDNDMDLLKLEVKSFTRMRETLLRAVQGRKDRGQVLDEVEHFDINRNVWNLSLLEHPRAAVQGLLANASEAMGSRAATTITELPKRSWIMAAPTPDAQTRMTPESRTARISWRMFTVADLDRRFQAINAGRQSTTSWRGLGLDYNTSEWYVPTPPEIAEGVKAEARERRSEMLDALEKRGAL